MKIYKLRYGISGMFKFLIEEFYQDLAIGEQCLYEQIN